MVISSPRPRRKVSSVWSTDRHSPRLIEPGWETILYEGPVTYTKLYYQIHDRRPKGQRILRYIVAFSTIHTRSDDMQRT